MRMLSSLLGSFIRNGKLHLVAADGSTHLFGGRAPGPEVEVRLHDAGLHRRLALNPELAAGEAYMDGTLTIGRGGSVHDLLLLFSVNREGLGAHGSQKLLRRLWRTFRRWQQANPVVVSARNARHHYDIGTDLYRLFLDEGLNYSCAFFETLITIRSNRRRPRTIQRIVAKLRLQPGMTVAGFGSGWGSLAIAMAERGAKVVAINLARDQLAVSRARAEAAGVAGHIEFREQDYRSLSGQFDRVVSVGMMEHVGIGQFDAYFGTIRGLLAPRSYALVHCIGRMTPPGTTGPFIRKYIFPGGYVPALSEVFTATERIGLWVADMEVLRCITTTRSGTGGRALLNGARRLRR